MKNRFYVSETYSEVTPESAEHGDHSETGFEYGYNAKNKYRQEYALKEIVESFIQKDYAHAENFDSCASSQSLYGEYYTSDYSTGTERQQALHIRPIARRGTKAYKRAARHLNRAIAKYLK